MKVVVITCAGETTRQNSVKSWAQHIGSIQWHVVQRDSSCPRRGIYNSHRDVARQVVASQSDELTLVLEDDAVPTVEQNELQERFKSIANEQQPFDMYYLGLNAQRAQIWSQGRFRVAGFCLHAYVMSHEGALKLAALPEYSGVEIDRITMEQCGLHNPSWKHSWVCVSDSSQVIKQNKSQFVSLLTPTDIRYSWPVANTIAETLDAVMHAWIFKIEQLLPRNALLLLLIIVSVTTRSAVVRCLSVGALGLNLVRLERL
jgi:hypothetical protein